MHDAKYRTAAFPESQFARREKEREAACGRLAKSGLNVHPEFGSSYASLGAAYADMKDYVKAIVYYEEALEILKKSRGSELKLRDVYNELARLHAVVGNETRAEQCIYQARLIKP